MTISLVCYLTATLGYLLFPVRISYYPVLLIFTLVIFILSALIIIYMNRPVTKRTVYTVFSVCVYWLIESFITFKALISLIFKRNAKWIKTLKSDVYIKM